MKMKLIALSVAAASMMPVVVAADTTLYGKAHLAVESEGADESVIKVKSHASRVGLKGEEDIGNGLKAVYKFEWQLDMADKSKGSDDHIKSRNQYAGLSGGFGTVLFGRHDTPLKMSQGKFDLFGDIYGDIARHLAGEARADNVIAWVSPKFGDAKIVAAYVPAENADNDKVISIAAMYGSKPLYLALAYNAYDEAVGVGDSLLRATLTWKAGSFGVGAMFQQAEPTTGDGTTAYAVNGFFKSGSNKFKLQFQAGEGQDVGIKTAKIKEDAATISVGWDRKMSKRTKIYLAAHNTTFDDDAKDDFTNIGFGLVHKF